MMEYYPKDFRECDENDVRALVTALSEKGAQDYPVYCGDTEFKTPKQLASFIREWIEIFSIHDPEYAEEEE